MPVPGLKSDDMGPRVVLVQEAQIIENGAVEWYSGNELYTRPVRIRINDIWEDVSRSEKSIVENEKQERSINFRCNIGDNRIITILVPSV